MKDKYKEIMENDVDLNIGEFTSANVFATNEEKRNVSFSDREKAFQDLLS